MYTQFYGLSERPFSNVPDTTFLFKSRQYLDAYNQLLYGVHAKQGFMALVGDVGTGKTTLCRSLLHALEGKMETALIFNPPDTATALLRTILQDLGQRAAGTSKQELLDSLNAYLLHSSAQGRGVVIIIDEAQNLSSEVLEEIRLLSNLETEKEKLLQIILSGQPELLKKLSKATLRQLYQRIAVWAYLKPLSRKDVSHYIYHRLVKAGANGSITFAWDALQNIYRASGGIPRIINIVCDKALIAGYVAQKKKISRRMVKEAVKNSSRECTAEPAIRFSRWYALILGISISVFLLGIVLPQDRVLLPRLLRFITLDTYDGTRMPAALLPAVSAAAVLKTAAPPEPLPQPPVQPPAAPRSGAFDSDGVLRQDRPGECAPEALATLLALWNVPQDALAQEVQKRAADPLFSFSAMAEGFNLAVTSLDITLEQVRRLDYPCIIPLSDPAPRYVVLAGVNDNQALLLDPRHGKRSVPFNTLHEQWIGKAFYVWKDIARLPQRLQRGDAHQQIMVLKEKLSAKQFPMDTPLTDTFDSRMETAVKELQTQYGLKVDGIIGRNTKIALYRVIYDAQLPHLIREGTPER
jgi:general secretion pathway protein A